LIVVSVTVVASAQQHRSYVADANREYAAIFSHPAKGCTTEQTTVSYGDCIGKEVTFTESHLERFLTAIRGIASRDDAGAAATPAPARISELALVNQADSAWQQYRKNVCDLTAAGMAGGSGEGNAAAECVFKMDRVYAQQLADAVYLHTLAE
jgi:uncharacterized protein YecT (DUF1311 family)